MIGGGYNETIVQVYKFADGAKKAEIPLAKGQKITALGISPDGTKVAVLCQATDDPSETKAERSATPKDVKGAALKDWQLKNDGKTSAFLMLEVASSSIASEKKTYFSGNRGSIAFGGDGLTYISPANANATITPAGEFTVFELPNMNNSGIGFTRNQSHILTGGVERFSITPAKDMKSIAGKVETLGSFQESFIAFAGTDDGAAIYGTTNAYRVFKLDSKGMVLKEVPGI